MTTVFMQKFYDLIIIGAGPAGLTAGIYGARYNIKHLIISENIGGMAQEAWHVENYPGILKITGKELTEKMAEQAEKLGSQILIDQAAEVSRQNSSFQIKTVAGKKLQAASIILAMGTKNRQLNIKGEEKFLGRGVSYCFTCDGIFFKDKIVAVVGGGNAAANAALALCQYAKKVYLLVRKPEMRAQPALVDKINKNKKIQVLYQTEIKELQGKDKLEKIILNSACHSRAGACHSRTGGNPQYRFRNKCGMTNNELLVDGLFIEIGAVPSNTIVKQLGVKLDAKGYIKVDACQKTNIPGVFAAGSVTSATCYLNQIVVTAAQGAIASHSVNLYLKK